MKLLLLACLVGAVLSDTYLSNPRGSNNRLNENTATRKNANRLFDSQNNNRGGYNTGDKYDKPAGNDYTKQYSMQYYMSGESKAEASKMIVEWTNQHGCGGNKDSPHKTNCNVVIQMMCMNNIEVKNDVYTKNVYMRDGTDTNTQGYQQPSTREITGSQEERNKHYKARMDNNNNNQVQFNRGLHETVHWYDMCRFREANKGLYIADQKLGKGSLGYVGSERTRQNNNGNRRGYECPEERDYYPYWQPTHQYPYSDKHQTTPWLDVAYLSGNDTDCSRVKAGSENQHGKFRCVLSKDSTRDYGKSINPEGCTEEGGNWVEFHSYLDIIESANTEAKCNTHKNKDKRNKISWMALRSDSKEMKCVVQAPLPKCGPAPWTRVNHLGNSADNQGNASRVEIDMPYFPSGNAKRCVLRLRYNITTDEFDNYATDHKYNYNLANGVVSPVEQNPYLDIAGNSQPLRLAMNTNQYGRTFQDRTHAFIMLPRTAAMSGKLLHNLNVRGKRGNIVQTFPAVEYDFVPNKLTVDKNDLLHIQWTGSNTHNNGGDGGDGQAGDDGEGTKGTDRSNFLEMKDSALNYPVPFETSKFWDMVESVNNPKATGLDLAIGFATSGYYCGYKQNGECKAGYYVKDKQKAAFDKQLNNAPASYFGHVLKFKKTGQCIYMCSRNNNFSNRSQKGVLWVK